jgi:hypothetical protein
MTESPGFGTRLTRFMKQRNLHAGAMHSVPEAELLAVIEGSVPAAGLLLQLAPVLGLHAPDLFVLAGAPVPEGLAPLDPAAGSSAIGIASDAVALSTERAHQLQQLIRALPQEERTKPVQPPKQYDASPGAFLLGMLHNRNLARYYTAGTVYIGTRGRVYLSEIDVQLALARSDKSLTPDMFAGLENMSGIPVADLAVLTGFDLPSGFIPKQTIPTILAELLWDVRRLTSKQARHMAHVGRSMLQEGRRVPLHET